LTERDGSADLHPDARFYVRIAILLAPIQHRALESLHGRKALASGLTMLVAVTFFLVPVTLVSSAVSAQAANLLALIESIVPANAAGRTFDLTRLRWLSAPLEWLSSHLSITRSHLQEWLLTGAREALQSVELTRAVFLGIGLTAVIQGALVGVGMAIAGLPSAILRRPRRVHRPDPVPGHGPRLGACHAVPRRATGIRAGGLPVHLGHARGGSC
jgi:predicted PurR-regulated permease PerM